MKVSIIFDPAFQGIADGAVWIIETPENRQWFERQNGLDKSSAVFTPENGRVGPVAVMRSVWNVQEHYPEWSEINVSGVPLTTELAGDLVSEGIVTGNENGFALKRNSA